jgi:hypothetical protein
MGEAILLGFTFLGAWLALGTELLSALGALTRPGVLWFWGISLLVGLGILFWLARLGQLRGWQKVGGYFSNVQHAKHLTLWLGILILITLVLLLVAVIAPPNTNDSLAYHMPRVALWVQQKNLDFYTTPVPRQLWMPPLAEWAVLHLYLLTGNDQLANLPQWLAMAASLLVCALLASRLNRGHPARAGLLASLFCATLPMGALQATSNQTDYVTAFWLICLAYWTVRAHQAYPRGEYLTLLQFSGLACATGLGMLTKGTFYPFAAPFLVWLLVSMLRAPTSILERRTQTTWRKKLAAIGVSLALSLAIITLLNAGQWLRNQKMYGFPLGPRTGMTFLSNETFSPAVLVSNLLRNSTLHLGTPFGIINGPLRQAVETVHAWIGLDPSDPRTSLDEYRVRRSRQEDYAGNFWHFIFIGLSMLIALAFFLSPSKRKSQPKGGEPAADWSALAIYSLALLGGFLLYSALFKWQATGSRLQLPLFVAAAPLVGTIFAQPLELISPAFRVAHPSLNTPKAGNLAFAILAIFFLLVGYPSILSNPSRPLIVDYASAVDRSILNLPRSELLFANAPEIAPTYFSLANAIALLKSCDRFGLILDSHDAAYPFWAFQNPSYGLPTARPISWYYLDDASGKIGPAPIDPKTGNRVPICAIVCTLCSQPELDLPGGGHFTAESSHPGGFILYRLRKDD